MTPENGAGMKTALGRVQVASIEITKACNQKCFYCFNNSAQRLPNEFGLEQWKKTIDALRDEHAAEEVLITGGEVGVCTYAPELMEYALSKGLKTSILSNGTNFERYAALLPRLERVQISYDGSHHDQRRGVAGARKTALNAIRFARSHNANVEISVTADHQNVSELEEIAALAFAAGCKLLIRTMQPIGRAGTQRTGLETSDKKIDAEIMVAKANIIAAYGNSMLVEDFAKYVPNEPRHDSRWIPQGYVTISPLGTIRGTSMRIMPPAS